MTNAATAAKPMLLTVNEVASLLRVHPATVRRMLERKELRGCRIGRAVRIVADEVDDLLAREAN